MKTETLKIFTLVLFAVLAFSKSNGQVCTPFTVYNTTGCTIDVIVEWYTSSAYTLCDSQPANIINGGNFPGSCACGSVPISNVIVTLVNIGSSVPSTPCSVDKFNTGTSGTATGTCITWSMAWSFNATSVTP